MLALAIAGAPLFARQDPQQQPEQEKKHPAPKQQPQEKPKAKPPEPKQEPAPAPKQPKEEQKRQKEQQKQQKEQTKENQRQQTKTTEQQSRRTESGQKARGKGQKIPAEKFRADFGPQHHFRVTRHDERRFQYGGYWFEVVEVWPASWDFDDDCYIEEDGDDYYLVDVVHPELRVVVIVVS